MPFPEGMAKNTRVCLSMMAVLLCLDLAALVILCKLNASKKLIAKHP